MNACIYLTCIHTSIHIYIKKKWKTKNTQINFTKVRLFFLFVCFQLSVKHRLYHFIFTSPKKKKEQKIQTSDLQKEDDVKSRNHSVPFESDSIKQQRGVTNHRVYIGERYDGYFVHVKPSECTENDRSTLRRALLLVKGLFLIVWKQITGCFNLLKCLQTSAYSTIYTITHKNRCASMGEEWDTQRPRSTLDTCARITSHLRTRAATKIWFTYVL